ncbi:MAG: phosphate ABC transporter permease subunit PstC [Anaerolineae bacterium]|nr:phosphate ABC transporter permease subunit PstC [Anaerolineae bacterium]
MNTERWRRLKDRLAGRAMGVLAFLVMALVLFIVVALAARARPLLDIQSPVKLLASSEWRPLQGKFGFLTFIVGTVWVTLLAMALAVPPCLLCAIYLAEYAPRRLREMAKPVVDLLAGIPSVVYGLWGILIVVPFVRDVVTPLAAAHLGAIPLLRADNLTGYGILSSGVVLAVMVFPVLISVTEEVIRAVPDGMRVAALALGATRWQMIKGVVLRRALPGIIAAIVLGFSRAFGETMAVMMVVGNVPQIPHSLFDAAYPLPALIANNYGEMMSIPLYDSALLAAALVLLFIVLFFTIAARIILLHAVRRAS